MDQQQQQQQQFPQQSGAPYGGGYGYGGGVAPQHYPPHLASAGPGGSTMAAPTTNYNTQGNTGPTTIPNYGGSMRGPPGASAGVSPPPPGAANYYGAHPTALPPPQVGGFQPQAPIPNNGGNNSGRSSQSGNTTSTNGSKSSKKSGKGSKKRRNGDEDPSVFNLFASVLTGISRQTKACLANSCGAESDDEDEDMANPSMTSDNGTDGANVNAERILVQNEVDPSGNIYSGQKLGGKRDGLGTIHYATSGDRYEGMWQGHQPHGDGKVIRGDGSGMFEGRWNHGTLQMVKNGECYGIKYNKLWASGIQRKQILINLPFPSVLLFCVVRTRMRTGCRGQPVRRQLLQLAEAWQGKDPNTDRRAIRR